MDIGVYFLVILFYKKIHSHFYPERKRWKKTPLKEIKFKNKLVVNIINLIDCVNYKPLFLTIESKKVSKTNLT